MMIAQVVFLCEMCIRADSEDNRAFSARFRARYRCLHRPVAEKKYIDGE